MNSEETKSASLAKFLNGFSYAIVDTCSLMEESFAIWTETVKEAKPDLKKDLHIYVLGKCEGELKKHVGNTEEAARAEAAKKALEILKKNKRSKIFEITKVEKHQNFADNAIYTQVSRDRITSKILVITQDKKLASDLKGLNALVSQRGFKVSVYRINRTGELEINKGEQFISVKDFRKSVGAIARKSDDTPKTLKKAPHKNDQDSVLAQIIDADKKLKCNLSNSNYGKQKKVEDIKNQQKLLLQVSPAKKRTLVLNYDEKSLKSALESISKGKPIVAPVENNTTPQLKEAKKKLPLPKESIKESRAETPKKAEDPKPTDQKVLERSGNDTTGLWYENGKTLDEAISKALAHHNVIIRDPSIPYFQDIHGILDVTVKETAVLSNTAKFKDGQKSELVFKSSRFVVEPSKGNFKVWFDPFSAGKYGLAKKPEVKKSHGGKKKQPTSPITTDKTVKKEVVTQNNHSEQLSKKPAKATQTIKSEDTVIALPEGVVLNLGGAPSSKEKKPKKATQPVANVSGPAKVIETTQKEKPKKEVKQQKTKAEAPAKKQQKPVKEETKPKTKANNPPKEVAKASTQNETKPTKPKKEKSSVDFAPKAPSEDFKQAKRSEARLKSVLSNPNYATEDKLEDLQKQLEAVRKLKPAEVDELDYGPDVLKGMIGMMKSSAK